MTRSTAPSTQSTNQENAMNASELDTVYTQLCKTMTQLGEASTPLFLARFALLAVGHIGDAQAALSLIEAAREELPIP
jgi:hypothetical protein